MRKVQNSMAAFSTLSFVRSIIAVLFLPCFSGCQDDVPAAMDFMSGDSLQNNINIPPAESAGSNPGDGLTFVLDSLRRTGGDCENPELPCATVFLRYPVAQGGNEKVRNIINDSIALFLISSVLMESSNNSMNILQASDKFLDDFRRTIKEMGDDAMGWSVESDGKVSYQNAKIISLNLDNYTFTGGAHPNHYTRLMVFDRATGKMLGYNDVFSNLEPVKTLVEAAFMNAVKNNAQDGERAVTVEDFFWGRGFQLPENFELLPAGIHFYYNPYEAAAYVFGPIEFTIAYTQLQQVLLTDRIR